MKAARRLLEQRNGLKELSLDAKEYRDTVKKLVEEARAPA